MAIRRDKTALHRISLSRPLQLALDAGLAIAGRTSIFDYGCGRGADVRFLRAHGFDSSGWDPAHFPKEELRTAEVVNLGFVINVIEDPAERVDVVRSAYSLAREVLIVAARLRSDVDELPGDEFGDGRLTRIGSFQCFYEQSELAGWLEAVLDVRPVAASPGVFFIFRDAARREAFVAERFRRRLAGPRPSISAELYQANRELLESLGAFFQDRGRLPVVGEWAAEADAKGVFGSIARAWAVVKRVTDADAWARIAIQRSEDLLVYMVQAQFGKAPRFSELPAAIQADVRAFFGTYIRAQQEAMLLLRQLGDQELVNMACKASPVGKVTPQALYVHESAIDKLPTVLRCYHACAEGLTGQVEAANLIKLHRFKPQVSFLAYPDFDVAAHPALRRSVTAKLDVARVSVREYAADGNPPILHRKEEFVAVEHPLRKKFERLTKQEEKAGLFGDPSAIGTASGWAQALEKAGVVIRGHQVRRR